MKFILVVTGYGKPKLHPEANERGTQIATEFYSLAKQWLTES